jgi:broad specificity phosphatase PhoE
MTAEEIEASNPVLYRDWRARRPGFEYPDGEKRADMLARIDRGLARLLSGDARLVVLVAHKGVIRTISDMLTGDRLQDDQVPLGGVIQLTRRSDGKWYVGRRTTLPPGVEEIR